MSKYIHVQTPHKMVGADFSQAEPRLLACYSQDANMIDAYMNKRDLYSTVASVVYNNRYEDNLEFYADGEHKGEMNFEGKERRGFCKSIILGLMYGRGVSSIAEQINQPIEKAQEIYDKFFDGFPKVRDWVEASKIFCHQTGYSETLYGRRRHLPDIQLPAYTIKLITGSSLSNFNPFLECSNGLSDQAKSLIAKYQAETTKIKGRKQYETLKQKALTDGIDITSNTGFISRAERQAMNSRVQGGSADITKRAMVAVYKDPVMKELDFHLLLCIHDELIGECPEANAEKAAARLSEIMVNAPKPECTLPFKCDSDIYDHWYTTEYSTMIKSEFNTLTKGTKTSLPIAEKDAIKIIVKNHPEWSAKILKAMLTDGKWSDKDEADYLAEGDED